MTLAGFALAALLVLDFASRLSCRILHLSTGSTAGDEVGDLSRSFSALLPRLAQHPSYLESMASRLSHELRTPIAVMRSPLESLHMEPLPDVARTYIVRAEAGPA